MGKKSFHHEPYDEGTVAKLRIFESYVQAWIPVFTSQPEPKFREIHIYDFFCGPGVDRDGVPGSPLRILRQLRTYQNQGLAGWSKVSISAYFSDLDAAKVGQLAQRIDAEEWRIPGVVPKTDVLDFESALRRADPFLRDPQIAKLLIIDQFGVDAVTDAIFQQLCRYPRTDFVFFISSSTLHRFRNHPAIPIKIEELADSYDVHRAAFSYFRKLAPANVFLGRFSIRKRSNIYGLVFGSQHPLGISKFLEVAWDNDEIAGEANFDIEREGIEAGELLLNFDLFKPKKIQVFQETLAGAFRAKRFSTEMDVVHFCIEAGMTGQHASPVMKTLKREGVIDCEFHTPSVRNWKEPRPIRYPDRQGAR